MKEYISPELLIIHFKNSWYLILENGLFLAFVICHLILTYLMCIVRNVSHGFIYIVLGLPKKKLIKLKYIYAEDAEFE